MYDERDRVSEISKRFPLKIILYVLLLGTSTCDRAIQVVSLNAYVSIHEINSNLTIKVLLGVAGSRLWIGQLDFFSEQASEFTAKWPISINLVRYASRFVHCSNHHLKSTLFRKRSNSRNIKACWLNVALSAGVKNVSFGSFTELSVGLFYARIDTYLKLAKVCVGLYIVYGLIKAVYNTVIKTKN